MRKGGRVHFINCDLRLIELYRRLRALEVALEEQLQAHEQDLKRSLERLRV
jgi:hypothetical protein